MLRDQLPVISKEKETEGKDWKDGRELKERRQKEGSEQSPVISGRKAGAGKRGVMELWNIGIVGQWEKIEMGGRSRRLSENHRKHFDKINPWDQLHSRRKSDYQDTGVHINVETDHPANPVNLPEAGKPA